LLERALCRFALAHAGGAGAEHDRDAIAAVTRDRLLDRGADLFERMQQQRVVAAAQLHGQRVETGQRRAHRAERERCPG
jgi:hypothetical protein